MGDYLTPPVPLSHGERGATIIKTEPSPFKGEGGAKRG